MNKYLVNNNSHHKFLVFVENCPRFNNNDEILEILEILQF